MTDDESLVSELALMVADGELSYTAWFEVVNYHSERWVDRQMARLDERLTLYYPEVWKLLASLIGALFFIGIAIAVEVAR